MLAQDREDEYGPASSSGRDPLGPILESFLARFRQGERPSLTEYIGRDPALADEIRELFPALVEIEQLGSVSVAQPPRPTPARRGREPRALHRAMQSATDAYDAAAGPAAVPCDTTGVFPERLGDYRILGCNRRRGHGRGLRGGAGIAPQPRGAQGHAPTVPRQPRLPPAVP